ncbi:hypothetical protein AYO40_06145 [Planctomycetaceae bacterium SCGC AG-212-D15]|nr:hypothetical protein AYO40_06145 [Planctomycetaceae bacterium SCGC AG-212-D15]
MVVGRTEAELLTEARAGNAQAFAEALRPHLDSLFAYSRALCGDFHAAEDVVQETALVAFRSLDRLYPEAELSAWLRGIAKRQAQGAVRRARRLGPLLGEATESAFVEPDDGEALKQERAALDHCLEKLGERAGSVVRKHYAEGKRLKVVAAETKLTLGAVKMALYRARMQLKDCVRQALEQGRQP